MMNAARIGGGILVLAGMYQLTSPRRICLAKCRAPQNFIFYSQGKEKVTVRKKVGEYRHSSAT
jgi:predicted metal-binding membrane protein